ncbi:MAG: GlxA family transcriptional regulator [Arenibacterium sp.]
MSPDNTDSFQITVVVTPHFNLASTLAFLDPFRALNYLIGANQVRWKLVSAEGGEVPGSNGVSVTTQPLSGQLSKKPNLVIVSSSWTPENALNPGLFKALRQWSQHDVRIGALDTGAFILAGAGLLTAKRATVHYEHIDAFIELFPEVVVTEDLFVLDQDVFSCCGGMASVDLALALIRELNGEGIANAVARYVFHHAVRETGATQNPECLEPFGRVTPSLVRRAIDLMEKHLEEPLAIPEICDALQVSQRHLSRLFKQYVGKTPVLYYRDIRLDRARGLVTQTEMKLSEVAVASGFASQVHFSRAYRERFGLPPKQDRIEGRVPFEFRAWPMHSPIGTGASS